MKCVNNKCDKNSETHKDGQFIDSYWTCGECETEYQIWLRQDKVTRQYPRDKDTCLTQN